MGDVYHKTGGARKVTVAGAQATDLTLITTAKIGIWIGDTPSRLKQVTLENALRACLQALREAHVPATAGTRKCASLVLTGSAPRTEAVVVEDDHTMLNTEVGIAYGATYHGENGFSLRLDMDVEDLISYIREQHFPQLT